MTLRTRIALIASSAVAVAVIGIAITVFLTTQDRLTAEIDESLTDRATAARAIGGIAEALGREPLRGNPFRDPRGFDVLYVQLVDPAGGVVRPPDQEVALPLVTVDGEPGTVVFSDATVDDLHLRVANVALSDGLTLQIARSLEEVDSALSRLAVSLALIGLVGVIGAAALGLFVARSSLRPIADLTAAAERVATTKELAERITVNREDELGSLARSFNEMLSALEASQQMQQRLVRDAGHELRTPLTALRTNIDVLARATDMSAEQRAAIHEDLRLELAQLTDLVNEVVEVAAERDVIEVEENIDLGAVAANLAERFSRRSGTDIEVTVNEPATFTGRPSRIERAIGNLIDNAVKWTPQDGRIVVAVDGAKITVTDSGPGIAPEDLPFVFDRFYRSTSARTHPGSGLGLSIVKEVATSHGGSAFADTNVGGGAVVGIDFGSNRVSPGS